MLVDENGFVTAEADIRAIRALLGRQEFESDQAGKPLLDLLDRREHEIVFSPLPAGSTVAAGIKLGLLSYWFSTDGPLAYADEIQHISKQIMEFVASLNALDEAEWKKVSAAAKHFGPRRDHASSSSGATP